MLGDISPQTVRITQQAVVYPGRDHVVELRVERFDGRKYAPVDMTDVTRVILSFPEADLVIVYDSAVQAVFTHVGSTLTVDLSDYAMPASVLGCQIILYDAEHPAGQVLVDDIDSVVQFDFRNVSTTGGTPPPAAEYITDAPIDGVTYARKDGLWVPVDALVSGVSSVNGQSGVVVLDAADVGADPAGAATTSVAAAVAAHEADTTPHAFVQSVSKLGFNTSAAQTAGTAELAWNVTDATVDLGLPGGVTLQVGQEFLLRGLNNSGATMVDTTVVYISGAQGNRTVFAKAQANTVTADKTIGVLTQDITNNQEGFATLAGLVRGIDTSAWAEGSELWLSAATAGLLTNVKPPAPNNAVSLGYVVRSHVTLGSIYVRVAVHSSLRELHDVVVTAPADGQVLVYDSATSTWVNEAGGGGSGEVNTASNLGTGSGVFAGKVGVDLQFKSLKAGAGVTLSSTATEVTIVASGAGGAVDSVNGQTGVVVLDTDDIAEGVSNLYFTNGRASAAAPVQTVDGQTGAVILAGSYAPLSHVGDTGAAHGNVVAAGASGFMTGADKTKLNGIAAGATANSNTDSLSEGSTNKYFTEIRVLATLMAGFTLIAGGAVSAADSLLVAVGKLQKQINDLLSGKQDTLVSGTNIKTVNGNTLLGSGGVSTLPVVQTFTGAKTLGLADINTYNVSQDATAQPVTLPAQATVAWTDDAEIHIEQGAAGAVTITGAAGVTINGVVAPSILLFAKGAVASLKRKGSNNWTLVGAIGTAEDQRAALGIVLTTSSTDTTADRVLTTGYMGLGKLTAPPTPADVNSTSLPTGLYRISTTDAAQRPPGSVNTGVMLVERFSAVVIRQTWGEAVTSAGVRRMWYRTSYATDTWDDWQELWTSYGTNVITVDTGAFGHATGSGGTATQATSKSTGVTLNKPSGQVTMNAAALAANTAVSFTLTNSKIAANDLPRVVIKSGATAGAYVVQVDAVAAGSCRISVRNMTGGSLSEALVLQFNNEKGATA